MIRIHRYVNPKSATVTNFADACNHVANVIAATYYANVGLSLPDDYFVGTVNDRPRLFTVSDQPMAVPEPINANTDHDTLTLFASLVDLGCFAQFIPLAWRYDDE